MIAFLKRFSSGARRRQLFPGGASAATPSQTAIFAVVDRTGQILGVRTEANVQTSDLSFAINGAIEIAVELLETVAGQQPRHTAPQDAVVVEQRPVLDTHAEVGADAAGDVVLKHQCGKRLRGIEYEEIAVGDQPCPLRQLEVDAHVVELQPRIDEVGLRLELVAGPEVGIDGEQGLEVGAQQLDLLPHPEAELAARELRVVDGGIEAPPCCR